MTDPAVEAPASEAVEAGAKAIFVLAPSLSTWEKVPETVREAFRKSAHAALAAATPHPRAEWEAEAIAVPNVVTVGAYVKSLRAEVTRLREALGDRDVEKNVLLKLIDAVIAIHKPVEENGLAWCSACTTCWPCQTFVTASGPFIRLPAAALATPLDPEPEGASNDQ